MRAKPKTKRYPPRYTIFWKTMKKVFRGWEFDNQNSYPSEDCEDFFIYPKRFSAIEDIRCERCAIGDKNWFYAKICVNGDMTSHSIEEKDLDVFMEKITAKVLKILAREQENLNKTIASFDPQGWK